MVKLEPFVLQLMKRFLSKSVIMKFPSSGLKVSNYEMKNKYNPSPEALETLNTSK